jgi:osmotically-inducible protein OsmY
MRCKGEGPATGGNAYDGNRFDAYGFKLPGGEDRKIPDRTESTSGTCASWYNAYQKSLLSEEKESGKQHIEVFYPESPQAVSDGLIHSKIIFALFADSGVDDTHIGVRVERGIVTLGGAVRSDRQKYRAGNVAVRQKGVTAVYNNLLVASPHLDHNIAENVKAVLESFTLIDTHAVHVQVDRGIVMLSGRVPNQRALETAGRVAWRTPGVLDVRNRLNVQAAHG